MTLLTEKGTFIKKNGTGSQEVNLTGAFQPKALWLWGTSVTANGTYNANQTFHYGFSDGTSHSSIALSVLDGQGDSTVHRGLLRNDAIIGIVNTASNAELARASISSFDSDGFTLSWAVNDASAFVIHYLAVGGTDITNVKVINTTVGTASVGNRAYTGVGFQGDFANFLIGSATATTQAINTLHDGDHAAIGAAASSTERWTLGITNQGGASLMNTNSFYQNDKCLASYNHDTASRDMEADFVSWGSDGFTLNYVDAPSNTNQLLSFIVIKGGQWDAGDFAGQNDTNNQTITTGQTGTPKGLMMFSKNDATTDSDTAGEAHARLSIGGADSALNQGCIWTGDQDGGTNSISAHISLTDALIRTATEAATHTSSTTTGECDIQDMSTAGQFTIDWITATLFRFAWFAVSEGAATNNVTRDLPTETITLSDSRTVVRNKTRARTETVTASD